AAGGVRDPLGGPAPYLPVVVGVRVGGQTKHDAVSLALKNLGFRILGEQIRPALDVHHALPHVIERGRDLYRVVGVGGHAHTSDMRRFTYSIASPTLWI